ncbi:MAG: hypothetical protein V7765_14990 [Oleispira sp.]
MNEENQYIFDQIKISVWSGFDNKDDIQETITDLAEDEGGDEDLLNKLANEEFQKKLNEEKTWPKITDLDLLKNAFAALYNQGVLCLHDAGYTMSDGHYDASEALDEYPKNKFIGYCFYHRQGLETAMIGGGLYLAFDHVNGDVPEKLSVALLIKKELETAGFTLDWDGTANKKIGIPTFDWKHRANNNI